MVVIEDIHIGDQYVDKNTNKVGEVVGVAKRTGGDFIITLECEDGEELKVLLEDLEEVIYQLTPEGIFTCIIADLFPQLDPDEVFEKSHEVFTRWVDQMERDGYIKKPTNE